MLASIGTTFQLLKTEIVCLPRHAHAPQNLSSHFIVFWPPLQLLTLRPCTKLQLKIYPIEHHPHVSLLWTPFYYEPSIYFAYLAFYW